MINKFKGEHEWLSNFYPCPISYRMVVYPSVEHAYQASKTLVLSERIRIKNTHYAGDAKKMGGPKEKGGIVTLRPNWDGIKLQIMEYLLRQKFAIPALRDRLIATGSQELIEGNWWGDTFWGVCKGNGENHLGKLLMKIRSELVNARVSKLFPNDTCVVCHTNPVCTQDGFDTCSSCINNI